MSFYFFLIVTHGLDKIKVLSSSETLRLSELSGNEFVLNQVSFPRWAKACIFVKCLIQCTLLFAVLKSSGDPHREQTLIPSPVCRERYWLMVFQGTCIPEDFNGGCMKSVTCFLPCLAPDPVSILEQVVFVFHSF